MAALVPAQRDRPEFRIATISAGIVEGRLASVSPSGSVAIQGTEQRFELADLTEIERAGDFVARDVPPLPGRVWLRSGNELGCSQPTGRVRVLTFTPAPGHPPIDVELRHIAAIRLAAAGDDDAGFARALSSPSATTDLVFAWGREGEALNRFSLRVVGIAGDELQVDAGGRTRGLPLSRIYGVVFGTDNGAPPDLLPKPRVTVHGPLAQPLHGALREWDGVRCVLRLAEGPELSLACDAIERVIVDSGRVAFLGELEPMRVEQVAALDRPKPWLRDRTPIGEGLELGGRHWRHGLCLVPRTRLGYDLPAGEWRVFEATVGIDDRSHRFANASIRVLADDRVVFDSGAIGHADEPRSITVDLTGVARLTLETDFGENLDLGDHCVFAGARLRKE